MVSLDQTYRNISNHLNDVVTKFSSQGLNPRIVRLWKTTRARTSHASLSTLIEYSSIKQDFSTIIPQPLEKYFETPLLTKFLANIINLSSNPDNYIPPSATNRELLINFIVLLYMTKYILLYFITYQIYATASSMEGYTYRGYVRGSTSFVPSLLGSATIHQLAVFFRYVQAIDLNLLSTKTIPTKTVDYMTASLVQIAHLAEK